MGTTLNEGQGSPYSETTIEELERTVRGSERGGYLLSCLEESGSVTIIVPGNEEGPRRTVRWYEVRDKKLRGRIVRALLRAGIDMMSETIDGQVYVRTGPS